MTRLRCSTNKGNFNISRVSVKIGSLSEVLSYVCEIVANCLSVRYSRQRFAISITIYKFFLFQLLAEFRTKLLKKTHALVKCSIVDSTNIHETYKKNTQTHNNNWYLQHSVKQKMVQRLPKPLYHPIYLINFIQFLIEIEEIYLISILQLPFDYKTRRYSRNCLHS